MANSGAETAAGSLLLVVAAALVDDAGRVLVQRRPVASRHGGLWEFPGGKVEAGETPERALVRELNEELAVAVDPLLASPASFVSHADGDRHLLMLLYMVRHWTGEPCAQAASALAWRHPGDMAQLPMPPADRPLVAALAPLL